MSVLLGEENTPSPGTLRKTRFHNFSRNFIHTATKNGINFLRRLKSRHGYGIIKVQREISDDKSEGEMLL